MANEAELQYELEPAVPFTCADGTGIEKGTLLKLTDPMTVALSAAATDMIAGIAAEEKIASDGNTKIGVYMRGVFKMLCDGTINVGEVVIPDGTNPNEIITATTAGEGMKGFGVALETGADGQTINVLVNAGVGGAPNT